MIASVSFAAAPLICSACATASLTRATFSGATESSARSSSSSMPKPRGLEGPGACARAELLRVPVSPLRNTRLSRVELASPNMALLLDQNKIAARTQPQTRPLLPVKPASQTNGVLLTPEHIA